jgi:hypothetical protein
LIADIIIKLYKLMNNDNNNNNDIQEHLLPIYSKVAKELEDATKSRGSFSSFEEFAEIMFQPLKGVRDLPASGAAGKIILQAFKDGLIVDCNNPNDNNDDYGDNDYNDYDPGPGDYDDYYYYEHEVSGSNVCGTSKRSADDNELNSSKRQRTAPVPVTAIARAQEMSAEKLLCKKPLWMTELVDQQQ